MAKVSTEEKATKIRRLQLNLGGARSVKRSLLWGVLHSVFLCVAPVCCDPLQCDKYSDRMSRAQRRSLLGVVSVYRTVSTVALHFVMGTPLIHLRRYVYNTGGGKKATKKEPEYERSNIDNQNWPKSGWRDSGQNILFLTWAFYGHRRVDDYKTRIIQIFHQENIFGPKDNCLYCGEEPSPEHTFSKYNRCYSEQEAVNLEVPIIVRSENLLQTILEAMEKWEGVRKMLLAEFLLFELWY